MRAKRETSDARGAVRVSLGHFPLPSLTDPLMPLPVSGLALLAAVPAGTVFPGVAAVEFGLLAANDTDFRDWRCLQLLCPDTFALVRGPI